MNSLVFEKEKGASTQLDFKGKAQQLGILPDHWVAPAQFLSVPIVLFNDHVVGSHEKGQKLPDPPGRGVRMKQHQDIVEIVWHL